MITSSHPTDEKLWLILASMSIKKPVENSVFWTGHPMPEEQWYIYYTRVAFCLLLFIFKSKFEQK